MTFPVNELMKNIIIKIINTNREKASDRHCRKKMRNDESLYRRWSICACHDCSS